MIERAQAKKEGITIDEFNIKVSPDDMYLYVDIDPKNPILINSLKEKWEKIKTELKENKIIGVLDEPEFVDNMVIVAKGNFPKDPVPEKIELFDKFLFSLKKDKNLEESYEKDLEKEKRTEDLKELFKIIICAKKEEAIGKWYPPIPGTPGINVWGEIINPSPLTEKPSFILGKNLYIDEKDNLVKAKESGVLAIEKDTIEIYPEYTLKGNVDFTTGNIDFVGKKLTIQGDVKFGFKVVCEGDLELQGGTENQVYIEVKGNFFCNGIIRGEETVIKIKGNAQIKAIEFAIVDIEGDLNVGNFILFSNCTVLGNIRVTEGKGIVYGGEIKCSENIEVKVLGNETHTPTVVFAGYNSELMESYKKLLTKEIKIRDTLEKLEQGIKLGKKLKKYGKLTEEKEKILLRLEEEANKCYKSLEDIKKNIDNLRKLIREYKSKTIKILEKLYTGVKLGITDITYSVKEDKTGPITFYLEDDKPMFRG